MTETASSRRVFPRYKRRLRAFLTVDGNEIPVVTKNLSLGGMYLITDAKVPYQSIAFLRIRLPAMKEESNIAVRVTWNSDDGVGVKYESLRAKEVWALNQLFKDADLDDD